MPPQLTLDKTQKSSILLMRQFVTKNKRKWTWKIREIILLFSVSSILIPSMPPTGFSDYTTIAQVYIVRGIAFKFSYKQANAFDHLLLFISFSFLIDLALNNVECTLKGKSNYNTKFKLMEIGEMIFILIVIKINGVRETLHSQGSRRLS